MSATPFSLRLPKESESGLWTSRARRYETNGIARFDGRRLVLEWSIRTIVSEVGMTNSRRYEEAIQAGGCVLPIEEISSAEVRGPRWWPKLEITAASVAAVADVPTARGARVVLLLSRHDLSRAQDLCSELRLALAEAALQSASRLAELPDVDVLRLREQA